MNNTFCTRCAQWVDVGHVCPVPADQKWRQWVAYFAIKRMRALGLL